MAESIARPTRPVRATVERQSDAVPRAGEVADPSVDMDLSDPGRGTCNPLGADFAEALVTRVDAQVKVRSALIERQLGGHLHDTFVAYRHLGNVRWVPAVTPLHTAPTRAAIRSSSTS